MFLKWGTCAAIVNWKFCKGPTTKTQHPLGIFRFEQPIGAVWKLARVLLLVGRHQHHNSSSLGGRQLLGHVMVLSDRVNQ